MTLSFCSNEMLTCLTYVFLEMLHHVLRNVFPSSVIWQIRKHLKLDNHTTILLFNMTGSFNPDLSFTSFFFFFNCDLIYYFYQWFYMLFKSKLKVVPRTDHYLAVQETTGRHGNGTRSLVSACNALLTNPYFFFCLKTV